MQPIGYSILTDDDALEWPGELYDYTWAENGVFIEAQSPLLKAKIPIAEFKTRGLGSTTSLIVLNHGKIPQNHFDFILDEMRLMPETESYYAITWEDGTYKIRKPAQLGEDSAVQYQVLPNVAVELHSHPSALRYTKDTCPGKPCSDDCDHTASISPMFSLQDDEDELGFKIYGVVGMGLPRPSVMLRVGIYGYFYYLAWNDVFEGTLKGVLELPLSTRVDL